MGNSRYEQFCFWFCAVMSEQYNEIPWHSLTNVPILHLLPGSVSI